MNSLIFILLIMQELKDAQNSLSGNNHLVFYNESYLRLPTFIQQPGR
jgi:hypothetical protein